MIVDKGEDTDSWQIGDRVVCEQHHGACMRCDACRRGAIHLCSEKRSPGWGIDSAFADYVLLPANMLHKVPDNVSYLNATITEPTAICITGLDKVDLRTGEKVLIIGPGPIGLISALLAKLSGASKVVVAGRKSSAERLAIAKENDLETYLIEDWSKAKVDLSDSFDLVIDSAGSGEAISLGASALRKMGRILELGISSTSNVEINLNSLTSKAISLHTSMSSEYSSWDRALDLMASGRYIPAVLATIFQLDKWVDAFEAVEKRQVIKGVITPKTNDELI